MTTVPSCESRMAAALALMADLDGITGRDLAAWDRLQERRAS